jgi:hypothetical protein
LELHRLLLPNFCWGVFRGSGGHRNYIAFHTRRERCSLWERTTNRVSQIHNAAFRAWNCTLKEDQSALAINADNLEMLSSALLCTHLPRHLLALPDLARILTVTG